MRKKVLDMAEKFSLLNKKVPLERFFLGLTQYAARLLCGYRFRKWSGNWNVSLSFQMRKLAGLQQVYECQSKRRKKNVTNMMSMKMNS